MFKPSNIPETLNHGVDMFCVSDDKLGWPITDGLACIGFNPSLIWGTLGNIGLHWPASRCTACSSLPNFLEFCIMVGLGFIQVLTGWVGQGMMALPLLNSALVFLGGLWEILACMGLQTGAQHVQAFQHP